MSNIILKNHLVDGKLYIPKYGTLASALGVDRYKYMTFGNKLTPEKNHKIRNRIDEIVSEEGGLEILQSAVNDPDPRTLEKLYGYEEIYTDKNLLWWEQKKREFMRKSRAETNLEIFEFRVKKFKKREKEDKLWRIHDLNNQFLPYMGTIRLKRLRKEARVRRKRSLSMSDMSLKEEENELFVKHINGKWEYIDHPPLPVLGMPYNRPIDKKKRGPLG